jgi:predicted membrane-bound spermidine synthase
MLAILTLLFILSGAAGLFYESVWSRYLGLFVGHNAYAQVIVLVIFLGGMALGAMLVGRFTERIREPLFGYALVEAIVGVIGLVFQDVYVGVTNWAYTTVFPATAGSLTLTVVKWGLAALLIFPQSVLLGMTFPLMSAGALRRIPAAPGRTLSILYFANSFGAAVGVLIAGFYLVKAAGLPGTILAAAILNLVVAMGAMVVMKYGPEVESRAAEPAGAPPPAPVPLGLSAASLRRLLLWTAFGTAVASFIYEIAWIRMLSLVLSSATHSFELMLSAFILGLALGAFWVRRRADRFADPLRVLGTVQWLMGFLALATLPVYVASFDWMATFMQTFARTEAGYVGFNLARYGICLLVMLPATFCAGITLPLITRTLVLGGVGEKAIGQVYGVNTLGSILGVSVAALVLMPLIGLKPLLATGALLDIAIGVVILWAISRTAAPALRGTLSPRRYAVLAAAGWVVVLVGAIVTPGFDRRLLLSGVYRFGTVPPPGSREVLYYKDGRTATVSAERMKATNEVFIATNGKSDGSLAAYWFEPCDSTRPRHPLRGDAATLALAALITLAHKPDAELGAVIGQGTGMSSHLLLGSSRLKELVTIEIEPEMIAASRRGFYPANRRVFDDPRARFVVDDAKSYFAAAGKKFDFIFSEPSHPWVSGVAGLFTQEFYDRINQYLQPDGVFAQWIHIYDINDRLVMTVLRALHERFRTYEVFMPAVSDMLVIATNAPEVPTPDWSIFQYPDIARDFCHQIPFTPEAMEATRLGNRASLAPLVDGFPYANSDFFPHLDNGAERSRFMAQQASGIFGLSAERFDFTAPFIRRRIGPAGFTLAPAPDIPRMYQLSLGATLRDPAAYLPTDTILDDDRKSNALYRERAWAAELTAAEPPGNWRVWIQRMADIERDRYGGTSGYADPAFYAPIYRFLDRHRAPPEVRAVVEFRQAVLGWDFARAARVAEPLVAAALDRRSWMPPDELRDGVVIARLATGDVTGARQAFEALAPLSRRPPGDFRTALLAAYVEKGLEAQGERRASAR